MNTPTLALLGALTLLVGSLGAPALPPDAPDASELVRSDAYAALRDALDVSGLVGVAPDLDAPVLHAAYDARAEDASVAAAVATAEQLLPAGWSLTVHRDTQVGPLRLPVDREDLSRPTADGTPPVPADARGIGPGSLLRIHFAPDPPGFYYLCTANFVFRSGDQYYLGAAGHCFLPDTAAGTHGTPPLYDPVAAATKVTVEVCVDFCYFGGYLAGLGGDFETLGDVAYARQTRGSGATNEDIGWDFGVVEIPAGKSHLIRKSVPVYSGPTGQDGTERTGEFLAHYGHGVDLGTSHATKGRAALALGDGIAESIQFNGIINGGDSGSPVVKAWVTTAGDLYEGRDALGVITHGVITGGVPLAWGTSIDQAIAMASSDAGLGLTLELPPAYT